MPRPEKYSLPRTGSIYAICVLKPAKGIGVGIGVGTGGGEDEDASKPRNNK